MSFVLPVYQPYVKKLLREAKHALLFAQATIIMHPLPILIFKLAALSARQKAVYDLYFQIGCGVLGFIIGLFLMWLISRTRFASMRVRHEEQSRAAAKNIADLEAASASLDSELDELRGTEAILLKRQGELEATLNGHKRRHSEQEQLIANLESSFTDTFKSVSKDAMRSSQAQFEALAKEAIRSQEAQAREVFDSRHQAVEKLIAPVTNSLQQVQSRVGEIEAARENAYSSLLDQVRQLAESQASLNQETHRLVRALRQPAGRAQWGEIQLRRCVEMSGMQEHCEFLAAPLNPTKEQLLRPDLIVKLPAKQQVVVDTKAPMNAYLEALEAVEESERETLLIQHAKHIDEHVEKLASAEYQQQFASKPEFTVLFLPSESFFSAALLHDPALVERGVECGVILATPTTFIALLRAISYGWRQEALAENAREIACLGNNLYLNLRSLTGQFSSLGHSLDNAILEYNKAMSSMENTVLSEARKFEKLGAIEHEEEFSPLPRLSTQVQFVNEVGNEFPQNSTALPVTPIAEPGNSSLEEASFEGFEIAEEQPSEEESQSEEDAIESEEEEDSRTDAANAAAEDLRAALNKE